MINISPLLWTFFTPVMLNHHPYYEKFSPPLWKFFTPVMINILPGWMIPCPPVPSWSPNSTYLPLDLYLLSWRWWPLWSGGLLYQWSLRPKQTSWVRFFRKISVSCTYCPWRSKKQEEKLAKTLQKKVFLQPPRPNFAFIPQMVRTICGILQTVRTICRIPKTVQDVKF